jgi:hypothetical protein
MFHCAYAGQRKKGSKTIIRDVREGILGHTCQLSASCMCSGKTDPESTLHTCLAELFLM